MGEGGTEGAPGDSSRHARPAAQVWKPAHSTHLGAGLRAVHDGVAAVEGERVLQLGQALLRVIVPGVDHPAIGLREQPLLGRTAFPPPHLPCLRAEAHPPNPAPAETLASPGAGGELSSQRPHYLHQHSWAKVLVRVPPVTGAAGAAASTKDALVEPVLGEQKRDAS